MQKILSPGAFIFAAIVMTLTFLGVCLVAPEDPYYRWQEHNSGTTRKADWIYERLHFDQTPIDVALIGTSRMAGGLSGPDIEASFCRLTGRRIYVANLSIPETGRNMHYVIAKEAMKTKTPALTLIELNEIEARTPHRGFVVLADVEDVLTAPAFINFNYFYDLARLPGRQTLLWFRWLTKRGAVRDHFEPELYQGRDEDRTREIPLLDGRVISRFQKIPRIDLDLAYERRAREASPWRLPPRLHPLEYRFSRLYLDKIETLAEKSGSKIDYVFLPAWRSPDYPAGLSDDLGLNREIIDLGGAVAENPDKWLDATHVNAWGAMEQSERLARALAERHPALGVVGC